MSDVLTLELVRAENFAREESRFEQQWSKIGSRYDWSFSYPSIRDENGFVIYDISRTTWQFGIHQPVYISGALYSREIKNGIQNPVKNIETLCHAFLYAVDCDAENKRVLEFTVPGNNSAPYMVCAVLAGAKTKHIYLELVVR